MKNVIFIVSIYFLLTSFAYALEEVSLEKDDYFKSENLLVKQLNTKESDEYGFIKKAQINILQSLPSDNECYDWNHSVYLLDNLTTKYFERGILDSLHTGFVFRGSLNTSIIQDDKTHIDESYNMIENHVRGYFKDDKTSFNVSLRYQPRSDIHFMQYIIGNAFITHQINNNTKFIIGNSRTCTGIEGSKEVWKIPFANYSQLSRNFGNIRKLGARIIGDYDLIEYDLGGYSSDSYFREFFPGCEFTGWVNLKPFGKTQGKYGDLKLGGGISSGHNSFTYNVVGVAASYEYKKFKIDYEFANADGYNGNRGLFHDHARGMYTTVYYKINPKIELLGRYDSFQPNLNISNNRIKEYVAGINYYIKGQGLKLILNYIFRENGFSKDSHRIIIGTQIML